MFKYTVEQLQQLKEMTDNLRDMEGRSPKPLTDELLHCLSKRFLENKEYVNSIEDKTIQRIPTADELLFSEPYISACGCMGPRDGDPFCRCTMRQLQYEYRYDIALNILKQL